jgi:hypothetical protein
VTPKPFALRYMAMVGSALWDHIKELEKQASMGGSFAVMQTNRHTSRLIVWLDGSTGWQWRSSRRSR